MSMSFNNNISFDCVNVFKGGLKYLLSHEECNFVIIGYMLFFFYKRHLLLR